MRELPACKTCINSGFLCTSCQQKLDGGELTEFEIDLSRDLINLETTETVKFGYLKDISFYKVIDYEDVLIIVVGSKNKLKITPELKKWIQDKYEIETLIFIEKTKKPRPVVEDLITPAKLISLNEIFLATGDIEFKAVLRKKDKDKILFTSEEIEDLLNELTGTITRVEFQ